MDRAYSLIQFKSLDDDQRIIEGFASTPAPDRIGDVMEPAGATFALPMPLLFQHDQSRPIGQVLMARPSAKGIYIRAQLAKGVLPFIDEAWALIKAGLVRGFSIGWRPTEPPETTKAGRRYKAWEWLETSAVTLPMNAETTILAVKAADTATLAALSSPPARTIPAVAGRTTGAGMTLSEQITAEKAALRQDTTRQDELEQAETAGTLTETEGAELQTLTKAIGARVTKIERLETREKADALFAQPVGYPASGRVLASARSSVQVVNKTFEKGTAFIRYVMAMAAARGNTSDALLYAKRWDYEMPEVSAYIKATAGVASGASPAWGMQLAEPTTLESEFIELLMPATVIGRLPGLRRVPFNVRMVEQTSGGTVNWVGELGVKPVGEEDFVEVTLTWSKIAGIVVFSEELFRTSSPNVESVVRTDLVRQIQKFMDQQLLDPSVAAGANNPASLTNGVTPISASAATAAGFRADFTDALQTFTAANIGLDNLVIVMHGSIAAGLSGFVSTLSTPEFPGMTPRGGTIAGIPVIVSNSAQTDDVIFIAADEVFLADDGQTRIDASREATLDMSGSTSPNYSLFQRNAIAVRAERFVRWQKRRTAAVTYINGAAYEP